MVAADNGDRQDDWRLAQIYLSQHPQGECRSGGNWTNGSNAGVFYLNLNNGRANSSNNIGLRALSAPEVAALRGYSQCARKRGTYPHRQPIGAGEKLDC